MPGTGWHLYNPTLVGGDVDGDKCDLQTGWGGLVVHQVLCAHLEGCVALLGNGVTVLGKTWSWALGILHGPPDPA